MIIVSRSLDCERKMGAKSLLKDIAAHMTLTLTDRSMKHSPDLFNLSTLKTAKHSKLCNLNFPPGQINLALTSRTCYSKALNTFQGGPLVH